MTMSEVWRRWTGWRPRHAKSALKGPALPLPAQFDTNTADVSDGDDGNDSNGDGKDDDTDGFTDDRINRMNTTFFPDPKSHPEASSAHSIIQYSMC